MIEEAQIKSLKRRTRGERTKRRERYLLKSEQLNAQSNKLEEESPTRLIENNNCVKCRQRPNVVKQNSDESVRAI